MSEIATANLGFVECWSEILTPKWIRFRHLLSGNGSRASTPSAPGRGLLDLRPGPLFDGWRRDRSRDA
ncbi:MAG: hypothetical protein WBM75_21490 [Polyangiales bacterium]